MKRVGIPDGEFLRGKVPMTKSEVRAVLMSKLRPEEGMTCLDVGCGTGSVTVELAMAVGEAGQVVALDQHPEAVELTKANLEAFHLKNVQVFEGKAPECIPRKTYDRIFIGGGGKNVKNILRFSREHLKEKGVLVVTAILLETLTDSLEAMEAEGFQEIGCVCMNVAVGEKISGWMMKANNPVYIIWGEK